MGRFIILLRGVNVGGARTLPMAGVRAALRAAGFADVDSYLASGNLILSAPGDAAAVAARVEAVIAAETSMNVTAIARSGADFAAIAATNPFHEADPKMLHLALAAHAIPADAVAALEPRCTAGERVAAGGGGLWIDYGASGVGRSKLTPTVLDRAAGGTVTARNANTVAALAARGLA